MGATRDLSRFVVLLSLAAASYLLIAEEGTYDDQFVAIGVLVLGMLAVAIIAYRFREDFEREEE